MKKMIHFIKGNIIIHLFVELLVMASCIPPFGIQEYLDLLSVNV